MGDLSVDTEPLVGLASDKLLTCVQKINDTAAETIQKGLEELTSLTKRSDDVSDCLDVLLSGGLLPKVLSFLRPEILTEFEGEVSVRGIAVVPVTVPLGEAIQLAACTALGELIWQRDTSSEVRPVLLQEGGMKTLATLLAKTASERVRLKVLVLTRRLLYEVGSTSVMDPEALKALQECDLMSSLVELLSRAVERVDENVSLDTMEGVTYLLQRMQGCMTPQQKEDCNLSTHLRHTALTFTTLLRTHTSREALDVAMLAVRELCWDDHNDTLEPGISQFADVGTFEAIAGLLAPPTPSARPSGTGEDDPPPLALLAAVEAGTVNKAVVGQACTLLERLAAAKPGKLPQVLEMQVPRLFHQVIFALVDQLDRSIHAPDRQELALFALRKLLVTDNTENISKPAAEAADAEGVPARLLAVAQSGADFGGAGDADGNDGATRITARNAAALLADLTASTALLAATEGRPAQAAEALKVMEPLVAPLMGQVYQDVEACRTFCRMLYTLSVIRWDEPTEAELDDGATHRAAPPDEEQYALSSQLVTMVGQAAQGLTALLKGGYVAKSKPVANLLHQKQTRSSDAGASSPTGLAAESSAMITGDALQQSLGLLQRSTLLMHELAGLKPQPGAQPISKHNIDALFVHGTIQALVHVTYQFYVNKKNLMKAQARAELETAASTAARVLADDDGDSLNEAGADDDEPDSEDSTYKMPQFMLNTISRSSSMSSLSANQNPLLHALLSQETGALELIKELVRDCADARIKLRDIGALSHFAKMLSDNPRDNLLVSLQFNLARSEALHAALRQEGAIALMDKVLAQTPQNMEGAQHEVRRLLSLCVLGLIASDTTSGNDNDPQARRAAMLLDKHDMPGVMEKVLREACRDGRYVINNSTSAWPFTLEPAAYTCQCLARSDNYARKFAEKKIPAMLLGALQNKHGAQPEPALRIVRALLNFARLPDLRADMLAQGAADALMPYTTSDDLRTCDAARGCLLQLGELQDIAAKVALQATLPQSLAPMLTQQLTSGPRGSESGGAAGEPCFDVLLSYKRQDAHALARALHTTLVLRGIGCLLDYEYQADLSDVPQVVARARNLVLILTDNCLTSPRCLAELAAAVTYDVNVIMVVKEGARWGDSNGNMLSQPPQQTIKALRSELHKLFSVKAVQHRDEHYAYFVTQLLKRVKTVPASLPATKPTTPPQPTTRTGTPSRMGPGTSSSTSIPAVGAIALSRAPTASESGVPQPPHLARSQSTVGAAAGGGGGAADAAELQALSAAMSAQTALIQELVGEFATFKAAAGALAGLSQTVQSLQSDMAAMRRELSADVSAHSRQVTGEVAAMSQLVRQSLANESEHHNNALASLRTDMNTSLTTGLSTLSSELTGTFGSNIRSLSNEVGELRRGVADSLQSLVSLQSQVRAIANMSTSTRDSPTTSYSLPPMGNGAGPPSPLARTAPPVMTAVNPDGAHYLSGPVRPQEELATATSLVPLTTYGSSSLPYIHHANGHSNGGAGRLSPMRKSVDKRTAGAAPQPPIVSGLSFAPNVGGFQGARIAATQAKLNSLPRAKQ